MTDMSLGKIFFLLSLFFVLFSFYPTWYEIANRNRLDNTRYFELVHNFYTDYNFYLSRIRQGIEGSPTVYEKYTSEPHVGSYIHVMYLAMGWVGSWVRVPWGRSGDVYHVARLVLGMGLLLAISAFVRSCLKKEWAILGFLLAVTASTWPTLVHVEGSLRWGGYMSWWSVMDSLQRITFVPHLLAGQILIVVLMFLGSDVAILARPSNWVFLGILAFILGFIFPPGFIFLGAGYVMLVALEFLFMYREHKGAIRLVPWLLRHAIPRVMILMIGVPALLYLQVMVSFYPWKALAEADILHPLPWNLVEYIKALGPMLPLGLVGLLVAVARREQRMLGCVGWVLVWVLLLWVFQYIPAQSPLRFSEMIPHVPLGILTAYLFYELFKGMHRSVKGVAVIAIIAPFILVLLGVSEMYSAWLWERDFVEHKIDAAFPLVPTGSYVMYPLKDFIAAIGFIQDATSRSTVILSETTAGNYIPVYSGNTVYVGHANTVHKDEKEANVHAFFSGEMKPAEAATWLSKENLQYIFFGPQEKEDARVGDLAKLYPFVQSIYSNDYVTVYKANL